MMSPNRKVTFVVVAINLAVAVSATVHGLLRTGNPSRYFGEGRWVTGVSCFQLLLIAFFAAQTWIVRRRDAAKGVNDAGIACWVWFLVALGFAFLAADEGFQIHEQMDGWIHQIFHLSQSRFTDRIDDAILGVYGLIGLAVLWFCRQELLQFRVMFSPLRSLRWGFAFMFVSVVFDALSNKSDVLNWMVGNQAVAKKLEGWCATTEGATMLLAEGFFVVAFYLTRRGASLNRIEPVIAGDGSQRPVELGNVVAGSLKVGDLS